MVLFLFGHSAGETDIKISAIHFFVEISWEIYEIAVHLLLAASTKSFSQNIRVFIKLEGLFRRKNVSNFFNKHEINMQGNVVYAIELFLLLDNQTFP